MRASDPSALNRLFAIPDIASLHPAEVRLIVGMRRAIGARSCQRDPVAPVAALFPRKGAAERLLILIEVMETAWPEHFRLGRPCCAAISADEWTFVQMLRCCAVDHRPAFDALLCEMMGADARVRLHDAMGSFLCLFRPAEQD